MKKLIKLLDKTGNEFIPDNIKNSKSTSKTDAYSCDYINKYGKLLWQGSFTDGSITVKNSTNYKVFVVEVLGSVCCLGSRYYGGTMIGTYGSYNQERYTYRIGGVGDIWTIDNANKGGSNGTSNVAVTKIYGLF